MDDGAIFAELHPALRRFAAAVRPPGVDPDDLMQEALARTLRRTSLAELDQPLAYLRRAILNLASGQRRTFVKRRAIASRMGADNDSSHDHYPSDLAELMEVPPDQRAVLYLHLVERLTHSEVGELLDITADASRARLSRGLRRLRVQHDHLEVHP